MVDRRDLIENVTRSRLLWNRFQQVCLCTLDDGLLGDNNQDMYGGRNPVGVDNCAVVCSVLCSGYCVLRAERCVLGFVSCVFCIVYCILYLVDCIWYLVSGICIPSTRPWLGVK